MKNRFAYWLVFCLTCFGGVAPIELIAALPAAGILNVRSTATASNVNGGGFNPANTLFISDATATSATGNSPVISSASYNFAAGDVNAWVYVASSANNWTPGWYKISSVASNAATVNAAIGAAVTLANAVYGTNTVAGCATTASPTGGTIGVDYTQQDAAIISGSDGTSVAATSAGDGTSNISTTFTSVNATFTSGMVGGYLTLTSGTNSIPGNYQIASFVSANNITLASNCTTGVMTNGGFNVVPPFSGASETFTRAMVGNYLHLASGTGSSSGWYEILKYIDAHTVWTDRASAGGAMTAGVFRVSGALSLGSSDDAVFELAVASATAANIFNIKGGATYTLGGTVSIAAAGNAAWPVRVNGYTTNPGDAITQANWPVLGCAAAVFAFGSNWNQSNISFTGTAANVVTLGNSGQMRRSKVVNSSATASRAAVTCGSNNLIEECELISYRGNAIAATSTVPQVVNCYIHDSDIGFTGTTGGALIEGCIFASNITAAIKSTGSVTSGFTIKNSTFYGANNKLGIGATWATGTTNVRVINSIFDSLVTAIAHADTQTIGFDNFNNFNNNTNDVSSAAQWQKGPSDTAVAPSFASVGQVTGTTGKFTAGNSILIDTSQNFTTAGVVAGRDFLYITGGTGVTNSGMCVGITSITTTTNPNDTLNLDIAQGTNTTADKTYQITIGRNFYPGAALNGLGAPGAFPGGYTTSRSDQGAVQPAPAVQTSGAFSN